MAKLTRGSAQYEAACRLFGEEYVEKLLADAEAKTAELEAAGIDHKKLSDEIVSRSFAEFGRFWQSARLRGNGKSLAGNYFGGSR